MTAYLLMLTALMANPPYLKVVSPVVDRGDFLGGPILKQTFQLTNNHLTEVMTITGLDSTCGCLRRSVSRTELKPGESADVTIEINTLTQPDGSQSWLTKVKYRLKSTEKTIPDDELSLRLNAKLTREVTVTPPMVSISTQTFSTTTIQLADKRMKPLSIKNLTTTNERISAKAQTTAVGASGLFPIELSFSNDFPVGTHDEMLIITTDDPVYRELRVPIRYTKKATQAVTAHPEFLDIEVSEGKSTGIVLFRRTDSGSLKIDEVVCSAAGVSTTWSINSGKVVTLKVVISPDRAGNKGKCDVRVKFSEPANSEQVVPISWSRD
jgi:Protein of unknown function (DUF1573)